MDMFVYVLSSSSRLNTMPKAILELEMPESCGQCMFKECLNRTTSVEVSRCIILYKMSVPGGGYCPQQGRRTNCPLRLADELCQKAERTLDDKRRGYQVSRWDDEPIEKCKNCKDFELYEEVEHDA